MQVPREDLVERRQVPRERVCRTKREYAGPKGGPSREKAGPKRESV